jgi:hypothetical protein
MHLRGLRPEERTGRSSRLTLDQSMSDLGPATTGWGGGAARAVHSPRTQIGVSACRASRRARSRRAPRRPPLRSVSALPAASLTWAR